MRQNLNILTKTLRINQTPWENKLWRHLRGNRLYGHKFKRQVPIDNYIADFCCQEAKLIVELDGGHHAESKLEDKQRQKYLEAKGYKVLRFWNNDIDNNLEGVIEVITTSLPTSPHHLGRGD